MKFIQFRFELSVACLEKNLNRLVAIFFLMEVNFCLMITELFCKALFT